MKIAVVFLPKTKEPPLVLLDAKDQKATMFMIDRKQQFAFLLALIVSALVIGYLAYDPTSRIKINVVQAVTVPRPQQVTLLDANKPLEVGDEVFVPAVFAPSVCKIAALPNQSLEVRAAGGTPQFVILGRDRYYVTIPDGLGQIVRRADLRQLVSN